MNILETETSTKKLMIYLAILLSILLSFIYIFVFDPSSITQNIKDLIKNIIPNIIGVLISFLTLYYFFAKQGITLEIRMLNNKETYDIVTIHENSVAGDVLKICYRFLINTENSELHIKDEKLISLKDTIKAKIKKRRELLRRFNCQKGRLDSFIADIYNPKMDDDFNRLSKIICSKDTIQQKIESIYSLIDQIQVELRIILENKLENIS